MPANNDKAIIDFLRKSYFSVDGLWFLRVEAEHSPEEALKIDEQVWAIMPKVQAKKVRAILGLEGYSLDNLAAALNLKFEAEGYDHEIRKEGSNTLHLQIAKCPWFEVLKKSGRTFHAPQICDRVCAGNLVAWADQLSKDVQFRVSCKMSADAPVCEMIYTLTEPENAE